MYELKLNNFVIRTAEPLSVSRQVKLVSAVLAARTHITGARMKSFEALACLSRPGVILADLPPRFLLHLQTLFRCGAADTPRILNRVSQLLQILDKEVCSPALRFKEYGTDTVSNVMNTLASAVGQTPLYQPGDVAYVRGVSLATAKAYIGPEHVAACVNAGKATGNPNEIMIKLSALDGSLEALTDTVIHEATHKFLGTEDEGMKAATFGWMKDDGLAKYLEANPGMPLPIATPGFTAKTPDEAVANAYILTAYILYLPEGDITGRTELNRAARSGPLGSATPLGQTLRQGLAAMRPPPA